MSSDDEMKRVSEEVAARLEALGIALDGREQPEELAAIEEAVERFEEAVESRGGDLMVDEGDRARAWPRTSTGSRTPPTSCSGTRLSTERTAVPR